MVNSVSNKGSIHLTMVQEIVQTKKEGMQTKDSDKIEQKEIKCIALVENKAFVQELESSVILERIIMIP